MGYGKSPSPTASFSGRRDMMRWASKCRNSWKSPRQPRNHRPHLSTMCLLRSQFNFHKVNTERNYKHWKWVGEFNSAAFHSHWGGIQMAAQNSAKTEPGIRERRLQLGFWVELLIYFLQNQSASWDITWTGTGKQFQIRECTLCKCNALLSLVACFQQGCHVLQLA